VPCTDASSIGLHHATYTGLTTGVHSDNHVIIITYASLYPGRCLDTSLYIAIGWGHRNTIPGLYFNTGQECLTVASALDVWECPASTTGISVHSGSRPVPPHGDTGQGWPILPQ
jgi:hypothetical protein